MPGQEVRWYQNNHIISRQRGSLAGQYKQMVQNGVEIEEFKNSPEDGEGSPLTRSAILPDLGWGS